MHSTTATSSTFEFVSTKCAKIVGEVDNDGQTYHYYKNENYILNTPPDLSRNNASDNTSGGLHDSPQGEPDRLGYHINADGITDVVEKIETPDND